MKITKDLKRIPAPAPVDEEVKTLQRELKALGIDIGKDGVDGKFGGDTKTAVIKAQKQLQKPGDPPFTPGVVDAAFAEALNKAFDKTKVGQIVNNRRKKFENKEEAIKEIDTEIGKENAKPDADKDRERLDDLFERKYDWLLKKLEEAKEGVWDGLKGYVAFVPSGGEEYFAIASRPVDDRFCAVIRSGVNAIYYDEPDPLYCGLGNPVPDNPDLDASDFDASNAADPTIGVTILPLNSDLLYLYAVEQAQMIADVKEGLLKTKTDAIENLEKLLKASPTAALEKRDEWRKHLDKWRERLDDELTDDGSETSGETDADTKLADFITEHEALVLKVYKDPVGKETVGIGHLVTAAEKAQGFILIGGKKFLLTDCMTKAQAAMLLKQDIAPAANAVKDCVTVVLNACQIRALISFIFNIGVDAFKNSTLLTKLNQGKYGEVGDEMRRWNKGTINGKKVELPGLVKRREKEANLFDKKDCK